jgi:hypothetical protein
MAEEQRRGSLPAVVVGVTTVVVVMIVGLLSKHVDGSRQSSRTATSTSVSRWAGSCAPDWYHSSYPLPAHRRRSRRGTGAGRRLRRTTDPVAVGLGRGDCRSFDRALAACRDRWGLAGLPVGARPPEDVVEARATVGEARTDARHHRGQRVHRQQGPPKKRPVSMVPPRRLA